MRFAKIMFPTFSPSDNALIQLAQTLRDNEYSFTTVTPLTHARVNARVENKFARNLRDVFGWSRPFRREILADVIWELMQRAQVVEPHENNTFKSTVRFSSLNDQLFLHSAFPTVAGDAVFFGPDTYRFADAIARFFATHSQIVQRAVDIGCGSGVGAILTALQKPQAQVFGVDINERALRFTRLNAALSSTRIEAIHSDLLSNIEGAFDLIVANPPYLVDESERAYRHGGGVLGADLSLQIVDAAMERLTRGGTLLLYTGVAMIDGRDPFREEIAARLAQHNVTWNYRESDPDVFGEELESDAYVGCDRIAAVVLTATKNA